MSAGIEPGPGPGLDRRAVPSVTAVLYDRIRADVELARWFDGVDVKRLRAHQAAFLLALLDADGDPERHEELVERVTAAHAGLAIDDGAFARVAGHLAVALAEVGVAEEPAGQLIARLVPLQPHIVTAGPGTRGATP